MARTKYTVTFPAAKAGDEVTWPNTVKVYADANIDHPMGNGYIEVTGGSFTGWSDAASVTFTRAGTDAVTVTSGSPTGTGAAVPSAASGAPSSRLSVGVFGAVTGTSGTSALISNLSVDGLVASLTAGVYDDPDWTIDTTAADIVVMLKTVGIYAVKCLANVTPATDCAIEAYLTPNNGNVGNVGAPLPNTAAIGPGLKFLRDGGVIEVRESDAPLGLTISADGWYTGGGTDPGTYAPDLSLTVLAQRIAPF